MARCMSSIFRNKSLTKFRAFSMIFMSSMHVAFASSSTNVDSLLIATFANCWGEVSLADVYTPCGVNIPERLSLQLPLDF
jgi:hypothetical protein